METEVSALKKSKFKKKNQKFETYQMTPIGLQAAVREANTKATTPIQRLALILRAAKDEKKSNNLPENSPLNLIANKIKEQLETQLKKFDVLEGIA